MIENLQVADVTGDTLTVGDYDTTEGRHVVATAKDDHRDGVLVNLVLNRDMAGKLYRWLGDWLMATAPELPDATADGYDWPALPCDPDCVAEGDHRATGCAALRTVSEQDRELIAGGKPEQSSIATEAHALSYGDRDAAYGHPRRNFTRTAHMWTALLSEKLAEGEFLDVDDVARMHVASKLSRDVNTPKRDNRVDAIGYLIAMDRCETGQ